MSFLLQTDYISQKFSTLNKPFISRSIVKFYKFSLLESKFFSAAGTWKGLQERFVTFLKKFKIPKIFEISAKIPVLFKV